MKDRTHFAQRIQRGIDDGENIIQRCHVAASPSVDRLADRVPLLSARFGSTVRKKASPFKEGRGQGIV
jgi:hypothetical protein